MTSYVVYSQIISGDNIIINPKYKIDMIACVINMILIAISLLLLFLLRKKKYKGVKKIIILTICFVTGLYILLQIIMLLYFFLGDFSAEELW